MTKILFFDVDGTLYNSQKSCPPKTKEAIFQAKENGFEVAIATGRAPFMIEPLLHELEIDTYVTFNGQYVVHKGEVLFTDRIETAYLENILAFGKERQANFVFIDEREMIADALGDEKIKASIESLKYPYPRLDPYFYKENNVYQTLVFIDEHEEHLYKETFPHVNFVRWHPYSCDILPKHGSKARGIEKLLQHTNRSMADAIAFGDGLNDIEMLQAVGLSVAMANGHEEVKKVADVVAPHVDEDGIYHVMKQLKLI